MFGDEVLPTKDLAHREVRDRSVDMRHEMQTRIACPGALDFEVRQVVGDELSDLDAAIDGWNQLQIDLRLAHLAHDFGNMRLVVRQILCL